MGIHAREQHTLGRTLQRPQPRQRQAQREVAADLAPGRDPSPGEQHMAIEVIKVAAHVAEGEEQPRRHEPPRDDIDDGAPARMR